MRPEEFFNVTSDVAIEHLKKLFKEGKHQQIANIIFYAYWQLIPPEIYRRERNKHLERTVKELRYPRR